MSPPFGSSACGHHAAANGLLDRAHHLTWVGVEREISFTGENRLNKR
jgi:hypothetical protein